MRARHRKQADWEPHFLVIAEACYGLVVLALLVTVAAMAAGALGL